MGLGLHNALRLDLDRPHLLRAHPRDQELAPLLLHGAGGLRQDGRQGLQGLNVHAGEACEEHIWTDAGGGKVNVTF